MDNNQQSTPSFGQLFDEFLRRIDTNDRTRYQDSERKSGWVYILECKGRYKIGYTGELASRLPVFKTSNPFEVKLTYVIQTLRMNKVEAALKLIFADSKIHGEWFNLSLRDIAKIKSMSEQDILVMASKIRPNQTALL